MTYTQILDHALHTNAQGNGIGETEFLALVRRIVAYIPALREQRDSGTLPILSLPARTDDLAEIEALGKDIAARYAHLVVFGTGGSSLGGKTLSVLVRAASPTLHFIDNTDPHTMTALMQQIDLKRAAFLVISKSGSTVETLTQILVAMEEVKAACGSAALKDRFTVITVPEDNPLKRLAARHGMRWLAHDPNLGGRFSVLSGVGLIPAAAAGFDVRAFRAGAAEVAIGVFDSNAPETSEAVRGAAIHAAMIGAGKSVSVLMPYCDRLMYFAKWYQQLWAESLGKSGKGSTPAAALGAVDQHSQLQLYLDGPKDKFITLLLLDMKGKGARIAPAWIEDPAIAFLKARTVGDVMDALQRGTTETLLHNHCPLRILRIAELNERALGALMMHYVFETIFTAHLLGVNAFDQPAVEESKILAREYLSRDA